VTVKLFISQESLVAHRDKFGRTTFGRKYNRRDDTGEATAPLPIKLPLTIRRTEECFVIDDRTGRAVCHLTFDDENSLRPQTKRFTEAEAYEMAQMIARLLTDVEAEN
jgi:hypothetical protein